MFFWDLLVAIVVGFFLAVIFSFVFRRTGPWAGFLSFFLIVFLAAWAGGVWITPIGPAVFGVYWFPFLFVGLLFAFLLAAAIPSRPPRSIKEAEKQIEQRETVETVFDVFFWFFIGLLIIGIVTGYFWPRPVV